MATGKIKETGVYRLDKEDKQADNYTDKNTNTAVDETDSATSKSSESTRDIKQEQFDTDEESLNKSQKANYAKEGGQYDRVNNKDYNTTLRLARAADRYNTRPREHIFSVGTFRTGGIKDRGTGYEKPTLETMETRAMNQAFNLDTNQKQLAQALQDAVNHKNLDAFRYAYQQLYGIELDRMHAEIEMRKWARQAEISNMLSKSGVEFKAYLDYYLPAELAKTAYNLGLDYPSFGTYLSYALRLGAPPTTDDALFDAYMNTRVDEELKKKGYSGIDDPRVRADVMDKERDKAKLEYQGAKQETANQSAAVTKRHDKIGNKFKAGKIAKEIDKTSTYGE